MKKTIIAGSILAGTGVILGALNAHALKAYFDPETTASFATGVRYQMYHAIVLLILSSLGSAIGIKAINRAFWLFLIGTVLFSGSIYILCALKSNGIIGLKGLGILTPIGGLILTLAWGQMLVAAIRK